MAGIVETKVRRKRIRYSIVNHKKEIETLIYAICALVILWIFVSFIEVNMHNMTDHIYIPSGISLHCLLKYITKLDGDFICKQRILLRRFSSQYLF